MDAIRYSSCEEIRDENAFNVATRLRNSDNWRLRNSDNWRFLFRNIRKKENIIIFRFFLTRDMILITWNKILLCIFCLLNHVIKRDSREVAKSWYLQINSSENSPTRKMEIKLALRTLIRCISIKEELFSRRWQVFCSWMIGNRFEIQIKIGFSLRITHRNGCVKVIQLWRNTCLTNHVITECLYLAIVNIVRINYPNVREKYSRLSARLN